jgi:hypothetical protein
LVPLALPSSEWPAMCGVAMVARDELRIGLRLAFEHVEEQRVVDGERALAVEHLAAAGVDEHGVLAQAARVEQMKRRVLATSCQRYMKGHEVAALEDLVERDERCRAFAARARRIAQERRLYVDRTEQALDARADVADADDAELPLRDVGHARHRRGEPLHDGVGVRSRRRRPANLRAVEERGVEMIDADRRRRDEAHAAACQQRGVDPYCRSHKK